ncbi:hypothetical protein [Rubinisphaera sp.]|uniref:hypothetical protein n=1 Tax=Rubinisphaera sp. TaxID=2024857 RepID=UPI000C0D6CD1|nr:hypothetical protein [Rubinisphaera sp.]MBV07753.1 hypothetical protein [Rubinisphaera sp.]HCS50382.1 hypothetical protein [Planctomycetaceae bacterium]|tara:strand:- start:69 stop:407 length:339 start_codon:yes stop_codon:yes gene_type:complete
MKNYSTFLLALIVCTSFSIGCGPSGPTPDLQGKTAEELNIADSKAELKTRLQEIADSGEAGSALAGLKESIESLKSTEGALAEELLSLYNQLESAKDASKIKSLASSMAAKL